MALVAVVWQAEYGIAPVWRGRFKMAVHVGAAAHDRSRGLVEKYTFAVGGASSLGRVVDVGHHFDDTVSVPGQVVAGIGTVAVADHAVRGGCAISQMGPVISLKTSGSNAAAGGVQRTVINRSGSAVATVALHLGKTYIGEKQEREQGGSSCCQ